MKISLLADCADKVERDIRPPMKVAVTLPVVVDGWCSGLVVYVAVSPFGPTPPALDDYAESVLVTTVAALLCDRLQQPREVR